MHSANKRKQKTKGELPTTYCSFTHELISVTAGEPTAPGAGFFQEVRRVEMSFTYASQQ